MVTVPALAADHVVRLDQGLVFAWQFDGRGGGRRLTADDLLSIDGFDSPIWVHLHRDKADSAAWLEQVARVPDDIRDSLLAEDTRPRSEAAHDGLLINLRGVNLNPDAEPDDMLALRIWAMPDLVVTLRRHKVMAAEDLDNSLAAGRGPSDVGGFVAALAERLTDRMVPIVDELEIQVDGLEGEADKDGTHVSPAIRKTVVTLRRFIAPQQLALSRLATLPTDILTEDQRIDVRHTHDAVTRLVEHLEHLRERMSILDDLARQHQSDRMARATYLLSLVATLFLPLGFLTGLLGINVGGIPGTDVGWAFWVVCLLLTILGLIGWWLLRDFRRDVDS